MGFKFYPEIAKSIRGMGPADWKRELLAGVTVAALALPLALTFAIASGMSPASGIWTAVIAGLAAALLGGSATQVTGPTGAFIPVVAAVAAGYGAKGMAAATLLAGAILFCIGALRLGKLVRLMPVAVVLGFTNGIALVIAIAQLPDALGFKGAKFSPEPARKALEIAERIGQADWRSAALTAAFLAFLFAWSALARRKGGIFRQFPAPLALFALAVGASSMGWIGAATIEQKFGAIPSGFPAWSMPLPDSWRDWARLAGPAFSIALLGAVESLLSAKVADSKTGQRHDPDQELMGQGIANALSACAGGFAATGAIARTATNVGCGGRTPVSGAAHALALAGMAMFCAPLAGKAPLCALSAIALATAWNMGEWSEFWKMRKFSNGYRAILAGTFLGTVFLELAEAIGIGMGLSLMVFLRQAIRMSTAEKLNLAQESAGMGLRARAAAESGAAAAFRLNGMLFFGSAARIEQLADELEWPSTRFVILDLSGLREIDTTGLEALRALERDLESRGAGLVLCSLGERPRDLLRRGGHLDGGKAAFAGLEEALEWCGGEQGQEKQAPDEVRYAP